MCHNDNPTLKQGKCFAREVSWLFIPINQSRSEGASLVAVTPLALAVFTLHLLYFAC